MRAVVLAAILCLSPWAARAAGFTVHSPDIQNGAPIPMAQVLDEHGCDGRNRSPALSWSGEPRGTRSFAVTMFDPDAGGGRGWWHWTVFDIPAATHRLAEGAGDPRSATLPPGAIQGRTDFGPSYYEGPCPPAGNSPHHYVITVYAVRVPKLPLDAQSTGAMVAFALRSEALSMAELTGVYGRTR